jgi:hypothetical protein
MALSEQQEISKMLMQHVNHYSSGFRDQRCPWCAYSAELDGDKDFLKIVRLETLDMLPAIRRIARG